MPAQIRLDPEALTAPRVEVLRAISFGRRNTMFGILTALHLFVCFALVVSVLLQSGKGGGLAGAFGGQGGGAQTIFGGRGAATFLSKATTVLGALFLLTALLLAVVPRGVEGPRRSLIQERAAETEAVEPAAVPEGTGVPGELPDAGTLPGESAPAPAEEGQEEGGQGATEDTQPAPTGGSSEGGEEKTDEG